MKKMNYKIILGILLVVALAGAVLLVQQRQETRRGATSSSGFIRLSLDESNTTKEVTAGQEFAVPIVANLTGAGGVDSVVTYFCYDPTKIELKDTSALENSFTKSDTNASYVGASIKVSESNNKCVKVTFVSVVPKTRLSSSIATINFKAGTSSGTGTITIDKSKSSLGVAGQDTVDTISIGNLNYSISGTTGGFWVYKGSSPCQKSSVTYETLDACNAADDSKNSCYASEEECNAVTNPKVYCVGTCPAGTAHKTDGVCSNGGTRDDSSCTDVLTSYCGKRYDYNCCACKTTTSCIDGKTLLTDKKWMYRDGSCGTMAVAAKEGCDFCGGSYPCYDTKALCLTAHPVTTTTCTFLDKKCSDKKLITCDGTTWETSPITDCGDLGCNSTTLACNTKTTTCTDSSWTSVLSPVACPSNSQQTRTWTKTGTCTGGVTHPSTETVSCTYNAGDSVISIKLAFAGVKKDNGKCATNWPVEVKVLNNVGVNPLDNTFNATPTQTTSVNSKGEIVYDYNVTVSNVPTAGVSNLAFFLTGSKHISVKYGENNQARWYPDSAGVLGLTRGTTNSYDFSNFPLLAGDVNRDGTIDGRDFSYIKEKMNLYLPAATAGTNVEGDINGDCIVNTGDVGLIKLSLQEIHGQTY